MPDDSPYKKDEIAYEEGDKKVTPAMDDAETQQMKTKAIKGIEQKQMTEKVKAEMGLAEKPKLEESVPKEIPNLFFKFGSKVLSCEKFRTDDEENKIIARHLSIIVGAQNSKTWSIIVILIIIVSKLTDCFDAVKRLFKREKKEDKKDKPDKEDTYTL